MTGVGDDVCCCFVERGTGDVLFCLLEATVTGVNDDVCCCFVEEGTGDVLFCLLEATVTGMGDDVCCCFVEKRTGDVRFCSSCCCLADRRIGDDGLYLLNVVVADAGDTCCLLENGGGDVCRCLLTGGVFSFDFSWLALTQTKEYCCILFFQL